MSRVRWRRLFYFWRFFSLHEATWQQPSISLPLFHWVQCTEFASAPYFAIKCQIHLSSLDTSTPQGCRLQEDFWQVWRRLWGNHWRSGAGDAHQGSWVGKSRFSFIEIQFVFFQTFPWLFDADWTRPMPRLIRSRKKSMPMEMGKLTLKNFSQ